MDLDRVYQSTILDYSRRKENHRDMEDATDVERGHNPSCGDDLTLLVKQEGDKIADASFIGNGCAISTASTNMLIELIVGQNVKIAKRRVDIFLKMMRQEEVSDDEIDELGDAQILEFAADMPARIKCATLSWHSLEVIFEKQ